MRNYSSNRVYRIRQLADAASRQVHKHMLGWCPCEEGTRIPEAGMLYATENTFLHGKFGVVDVNNSE